MKRLAFFGAMNRDVVAAIPAATVFSALDLDAHPLVETAISDAAAQAGAELMAGQGAMVTLGGSAFNAARIVALLNAQHPALALAFLGIAGQVGADWPHLGDLASWSVDAGAVTRSPLPPATCLSMVEPAGRTLLTATGANSGIADLLHTHTESLAQAAASCDLLHVTSFLDPLAPALIAALCARARSLNHDLEISLDPGAAWVVPGGDGFRALLAQTSILHLNTEEFAHLGGAGAIDALMDQLAPGPALIVARTHTGASVYERQSTGERVAHELASTALPPEETVVDATGAGDTFCGGFLWSLLGQGADPLTAAGFGFALARLKIGMRGPLADPGILTAIDTAHHWAR